MAVCHAEDSKADFIIKRNLRKEGIDDWLITGTCEEPRPRKRVYHGSLLCPVKGVSEPVRHMVFEVMERTSTADGQLLLVPEIEVSAYWTSLLAGTCATNNLVLHFVVVAYHRLRVIGQESLKRSDAPLRKKAERRRIRTVIQNLMTLAAKVVRHARQTKRKLGHGNRWLPTFRRWYLTFS